MPKFSWQGETPRSWVASYGPTREVKIPKKNGTIRVCTPDDPVAGFQIGEILKDEARQEINFQDETSIRILSVDDKFAEVVV